MFWAHAQCHVIFISAALITRPADSDSHMGREEDSVLEGKKYLGQTSPKGPVVAIPGDLVKTRVTMNTSGRMIRMIFKKDPTTVRV